MWNKEVYYQKTLDHMVDTRADVSTTVSVVLSEYFQSKGALKKTLFPK